MTTLAIIVAVANNGVIGADNDIPWHSPADLKYFKRTTMGMPILMGRKTWDSLKFKPLPGRMNIVITRDSHFNCEGAEIATSIEEALKLVEDADKVFIMGGANIYAQMLDMADELYLTSVDVDVEGDAFFPSVSPKDWQLVQQEPYKADDNNPYDMVFKVFKRQ